MNRISWLVALTLLLVAPTASAMDPSFRAVSPVQTWQSTDLAQFSDQWVHVKFVEGSNVLWGNGRFIDDTGCDLAAVNTAVTRIKVVELRPTFDVDRATAREWKALGETRSGGNGPDLSLWYSIRVGGGAQVVAMLINELNASPAVEIAHPEATVELASITDREAELLPAATVTTPTPDFTAMQGYLYNPPVGLNAPAAWGYPGGDGAGGKFIDIELCWTLDHEDFPASRVFYVGGAAQDPAYETHGTAVLGEVIGQQNGLGINGFAHGLLAYGVVAIDLGSYPTVASYFQEAVDQLSAGDAWLIELQMFPPGRSATPMEWLQVNYDVIWTSSWARNIICIEAGANGTQNLDDSSWGGVFDRNVRDSGAIMVAAGTPNGLSAESFTNYGSRMDVHAWGSSIVTTGYGSLYNGGTLQTRYTATFGGTSGASPMVTGSALCLGGIARAAGIPFTPIDIRAILHDTGTPHAGTRYIGPRPNLQAAAEGLLGTAAVAPDFSVASRGIAIAPNPFTESVELRFEPESKAPQATVFDVSGRMIRKLASPIARSGNRVLSWDGRDEAGARLGSGVYFLQIEGVGMGQSIKVQKLR